MKTMYKGHPSDVWKISKTNIQPDWVKQAFKQNYLKWNDDTLVVAMSAINPSTKFNLKINILSYPGYASYPTGNIGDYLDITNHKIISEENFKKHYKVIKEDTIN